VFGSNFRSSNVPNNNNDNENSQSRSRSVDAANEEQGNSD
jgi:hypothetical protein